MITAECAADAAGFIPITLPDPQVMPAQESGSPRRPSGPC
jgi:hypothetical protein